MKSVELVPRGMGGAGEKKPLPREASLPPILPRNPNDVKPTVPPKPQVRTPTEIITLFIRDQL